jgi:hypothetical protein
LGDEGKPSDGDIVAMFTRSIGIGVAERGSRGYQRKQKEICGSDWKPETA